MNKMLQSLLITCLVLLSSSLCIDGQQKPEVHTKLGKIVGSLMKTRLGKDIYAFRSIRYAKPPTGERRFLSPEPVDAWNDVYDATEEGPACIALYQSAANEDCLVLNVYTTKLPSKGKPVRKPVIVHIHSGGLRYGSGRSSAFGPQYLLDKDVILVTMNYRLGPLGFISTGDSHAPGNLGFKDQNLALRWVNDHIAAFGGNPESITLTGQSAGSRSVSLHLMSPMSKGLFHRAIALSGPAMTLEPYPRHQSDLALRLGKLLNCTTENLDRMFACLRKVPAHEFASVQKQFWDWRGEPALIWTPVIEREYPGVERFLPDQPRNLIQSGNFNQVPLITGVVRDELGAQIIGPVEAARAGDRSTLDHYNKNWDQMAPVNFVYERDTDRSKRISADVKKFYLNNQPISSNNYIKVAHIFADAISIYPLRRIAKLIAEFSKQPVYFSFFNYEGPYSYYHWKNGSTFGVSHTDDMFYVFYPTGYPMIKTTDKENQMLERLTTIWTNFAKTSKPIPDNNPLFEGVEWERLNPKTINYLELNNKLQVKNDFFSARMHFWEKLYP